MKTIKVSFSIMVAVLLMIVYAGSYAQTQASMNANASAGYQKADKELNTVYQKILKQYAKQPVFIKKLKTAQRLWVQLRDAELAAKYPSPGAYGSAESMCKATYLESLTRERTKFLRVWLDGIEEGDVCSGSVKMK